MYFIEELKRIQKIHQLISCQCTGSPDELAASICVSRRDLYYILHGLKKMGAKICYSRTKKTFYYTNRFNLNMQIKVSLLGEKETNILGSGSVKVLSESKVTCDFVALNIGF